MEGLDVCRQAFPTLSCFTPIYIQRLGPKMQKGLSLRVWVPVSPEGLGVATLCRARCKWRRAGTLGM